MAVGFSSTDGFPIIQLARSTCAHAKKACGPQDDLTREMHALYNVLKHLQSAISNPKSLIHQARGSRRKELGRHIEGCEQQLRRMKAILKKYNSLPEEVRSVTRLWDKVRFSSDGPVQDVFEIRREVSMYSGVISMLVRLFTRGLHGRMEKMVGRLKDDLKGIREAIDLVLAKPRGKSCGRDGSLLASYAHDDKTWWREFRHGLANGGYKSKAVWGHMELIRGYVKELSDEGVFHNEIHHSLSLDNGGLKDQTQMLESPAATPHMINREGLILAAPIPRHATSVLTRRIGYLEEQLLRSPNHWIETETKDDESDFDGSRSPLPTLLPQTTILPPESPFPHEAIPASHFPPPVPATRLGKHNEKHSAKNNKKHSEKHGAKHYSHHDSYAASITKSSTSSSSSSKSSTKSTRSFWGFKQRPKKHAR